MSLLMKEECTLCLEAMTDADNIFPLHCPSQHCHFNMCADCIQNMQKSEADGYQEASDGSRQVKFHVACPLCRSKYVSPIYEEVIKSSPVPLQPAPIVSCVLLLREAWKAQSLLETSDSELSAKDLMKKYSFVEDTTLDDLQEAKEQYSTYVREVVKDLHPLAKESWDAKFGMLPRSMPIEGKSKKDATNGKNGASNGSIENRHEKLVSKPWRDPTLFLGLDDLMSVHEQEFLTQLLCSNDIALLCQAANILHGILHMGDRHAATKAIQDLSNFASRPPLPLASAPAPSVNPQVMTKIKGRFPLPRRMPQCVPLPVYDPHGRSPLLKLEQKKQLLLGGSIEAGYGGMILGQVRGPAGRSGLRRGDVVTHINHGPVDTPEELDEALLAAWNEDPDNGKILVVVNADMETAKALRDRAQKMQQAKVRF